MRCHFLVGILILFLTLSSAASAQTALPDQETIRAWIEEMKTSPRGPFKRIRWFCEDGTVHPPKPYPCEDRGGGVQHGEWNERVELLRSHGYYVANVLADIDVEQFFAAPDSRRILKQILLEQFLIAADKGWIFRHAQYYRGALQFEDESQRGQELLLALIGDRTSRDRGFLVLQEAVRLLPHERKGTSLVEIRQLSRSIAEQDEGFERIRTKIHVRPDGGDAALVRGYASERGLPAIADEYERLAAAIDRVYRSRVSDKALAALAGRLKEPGMKQMLLRSAAQLSKEDDPALRLSTAAEVLAALRRNLSSMDRADFMLAALDMGRDMENEFFRSGQILLDRLDRSTRRELLSWLEDGLDALYGIGLITGRQWVAARESLARVGQSTSSIAAYKAELDYLSRVPEWGDRSLGYHFSEIVEHLETIEPLARRFIHDRLHGSPLLFYAAVLEYLKGDVNQLLGIRHQMFGETVTEVRGLNPGLARGVLRFPRNRGEERTLDSGSVVVLPATTDTLRPVAGILTAGEGNSLSHVQLLARNLGIPNVVVEKELLPRLGTMEGRSVVLAVSPGGVVRLVEDKPEWDRIFGDEPKQPEVLIRPDMKKLDLKTVETFVRPTQVAWQDRKRPISENSRAGSLTPLPMVWSSHLVSFGSFLINRSSRAVPPCFVGCRINMGLCDA
jgi:hypothetical protein